MRINITKNRVGAYVVEFSMSHNYAEYSYISLNYLEDYPWIKSVDHLRRINKYRKRHGQPILRFSDDDMAELILLKG